jgi:hypothetical protein
MSNFLPQIQSSGQRIEAFNNLQLECDIQKPLIIPLHSNVRWGLAYRMLSVAFKVRQVKYSACIKGWPLKFGEQAINLFVASADHRYGPITTIRRDGRVVKHIPWSAFEFGDRDWDRVKEASEILIVCECRLFPAKD